MNGTKNLTRDRADFAGRQVGSPAKQSLRPPASSLQVSRKIKAFQRLHFSSPSSLINVKNHISPSALADVVYQNGPIPEHDRMTRVHSHVRCSKFRDCRHGKVGTQAAGILTPTRPRSEWELPEKDMLSILMLEPVGDFFMAF